MEHTKKISGRDILEKMKKNDKFIGDVLAPFEIELGLKFNKFEKPEDPHYVEPKSKGGLKGKLNQVRKKQEKLKKMDANSAKAVHWKNAMDKAQGLKVKDDPKLVQKALKKKGDIKKKHQKKWADRVQKQKERSERNNKTKMANRLNKSKVTKESKKGKLKNNFKNKKTVKGKKPRRK